MKQNKIRKFFTLKHQADAGFTLVELIIVIAILAILAGVAVPVYNGYTEKAKEAADSQILEAVNKAFAAACLENGVDAMDVEKASVSLKDKKVFGLSTCSYNGDDSFVDKVAPFFMTYFTDNEDMTFAAQNVNSLVWDSLLDCFVVSDMAAALRVTLPNGNTIVVSPEAFALIADSAIYGMTTEEVTGILNDVNKSGELLAIVAGTLYMYDRVGAALVANGFISQEKADELSDTLGLFSGATPEERAEAIEYTSNGLQMCVADYIAGKNESQINALLDESLGNNSTELLTKFTDGLSGSKGTAALAMQYGMAQSFANNDAYSDATVTYTTTSGPIWDQTTTEHTVSVSEFLSSDYATEDPVRAINLIKGTTEYQTYMTTDPQYQKDVNGLAATLGTVGENLTQIGYEDYLNNGIDSENAQTVLDSLLAS